MLVFIDESGDPGLKLDAGSSKYFTLALVVFQSHDEALAADDRISLLRKEQGLPDNFEFHFNEVSLAYRRMFLEAIAPFDFFYFAVVINKASLAGRELQFRESLYNYACGLIFEEAKSRLSDAVVVIDENYSKNFKSELKRYLVRRLKDNSGKCFIKKVRTQDSSRNNLVQLADMIVGAVARSFSQKKEAREFRNLVAHREIDVQVWPK
jgi:hypothetical protein